MPDCKDLYANGYSTILPTLKLIDSDESEYEGVGHLSMEDGVWKLDCAFQERSVWKSLKKAVNRPQKRYVGQDELEVLVGTTWDLTPILIEGLSPSEKYRGQGASRSVDTPKYVVFGTSDRNWRVGHSVRATFRDVAGWSESPQFRDGKITGNVPDGCKFEDDHRIVEIVPLAGHVHFNVMCGSESALGDHAFASIQAAALYAFGFINCLIEYRVCPQLDDKILPHSAFFATSSWSDRSPFTPLMARRHSSHRFSAIELCAKYLDYAIANESESEAVFSHIQNIYFMVNYGPTAIGLSLSIAIEALISLWCKHRQGESPRVGNKLKYLQAINVIAPQHREAWNRLRDLLAHGAILSYEDDEAEYIWSLFDALHSLVAWRIGYKGVMAEYATIDYPIRSVEPPKYEETYNFCQSMI